VSEEKQLYPEDQKRVDKFVSTGVNSVERKPFRPLRLLGILVVVVSSFTFFSLWLAEYLNVY
jgi:hypothetical protein